MMTRKDYVSISDAIKNCETLDAGHREDVACALARVMAADNPRFDRATFYAACGIEYR